MNEEQRCECQPTPERAARLIGHALAYVIAGGATVALILVMLKGLMFLHTWTFDV